MKFISDILANCMENSAKKETEENETQYRTNDKRTFWYLSKYQMIMNYGKRFCKREQKNGELKSICIQSVSMF